MRDGRTKGIKKVAVVTGAGRGLGLSAAKKLLFEQYRVYAAAHSITGELKALKARFGDLLQIVVCDLGDTKMVEERFRNALQDGDRIDYLYNVAAVMPREENVPLLKTDVDRCLSMINVNTLGPLRVIRAVHDALSVHAVILNVSSGSGSIARCKEPAGYGYNMSKTALNMATMMLSKDPAYAGVRFICYHPGFLKTDMGGEEAAKSPDAITPEEAAEEMLTVSRTAFSDLQGPDSDAAENTEKMGNCIFVDRRMQRIPW